MPSEHLPSQSQGRPAHGTQRSTSSIHSQTDSPSTSPLHNTKPKIQKHVVGAGRAHAHARIPSSRSLVKLTKAHGNDSQTDLKKLGRNSSATSLKKNNSHTNLKRNRSSADVPKRPKSSHGPDKKAASVHFEIGDQDQDEEEEWEEASSASPALSRSATRSAASSNHSSAKPSANNSQPQSPPQSPKAEEKHANGESKKQSARHSADAKVITERLLQRSHSQNGTTTKMSLATATPSGHSPDSLEKSHTSTLNGTTFTGTPKTGSSNNEVVSRFVGGSGTPSESSPFLQTRKPSLSSENANTTAPKKNEEVKRAQSMGNLARQNSSADDDSESALLPRSRKSSQSHAYVPPQQSRTQQKLWLQRASSNIEPQQMAPGVAINGVHAGLGAGVGTSLVGAGYDGRDPRIKLQLERTGLEYLVVRRHQDPVGQALKRLSVLPGVERNRRIPPSSQASKKSSVDGGSAGRYGLSQSLKEGKSRTGKDKVMAGTRSSFEGHVGSQDEAGMSGRASDEEGVGAILRSLWEKNFDLSASTD